MTYIALHAEKTIWGTTRKELEMDELACWHLLLARAGLTDIDPPGYIIYFSERHLADMLIIAEELLRRTLEKCERFKKIKIRRDKKESKFILKIVNWEKYQHIYMSQKAYRQRQKEKREKQRKLLEQGTKKDNQDISDYNALGDRRGEEKNGDQMNSENKKGKGDAFPSHPRDQFLYILKEFSLSYPYPFNENEDGQIYDLCIQSFRSVDPIKELEKKIIYWKDNRGCLTSKGKGPRQQLFEFFQLEAEHQAKQTGENNGF